MDFSFSNLAAGFIYGVIGFYLFKNGKQTAHLSRMLIGIALMAYPYFVDSTILVWGIGAGLCGAAYLTR